MNDELAGWLSRLEKRHPVSIDLGLERCARVYRSMGSPLPAPLVLTVAGTNGKGSVVSYASSLLSSYGLSCGTYTSPHILEFNERIRIGGLPVTDRELIEAFEVTERARGDVSLTYFEFTTLAAFHLMSQAGLDAAVLEVGLGGRLDAVNLVEPHCSVITPIGLDHQQYLGEDREAIATEKAGIIRPGTPVVCSDRDVPASIPARAEELGARLFLLGRDFDWHVESANRMLNFGGKDYPMPPPPMPGRHQLDNLAAALVSAGLAYPKILERTDRWPMAVRRAALPGRLAVHPADPRVVQDVGHNPLAARSVLAFLQNRGDGEKVICVLGMLRDKDVEAVAGILGGVVDSWCCAGLSGMRSQDGEALAGRVRRALPKAEIDSFDTVREAVQAARDRAGASDTILVFGSFETVAAATRALA